MFTAAAREGLPSPAFRNCTTGRTVARLMLDPNMLYTCALGRKELLAYATHKFSNFLWSSSRCRHRNSCHASGSATTPRTVRRGFVSDGNTTNLVGDLRISTCCHDVASALKRSVDEYSGSVDRLPRTSELRQTQESRLFQSAAVAVSQRKGRLVRLTL